MSSPLIYYRRHVQFGNPTLIVNADPHTEGVSHWLAIRLTPRSSSAFYFDSYGIVPLVPAIQAFLKRHCTTWNIKRYNCRA